MLENELDLALSLAKQASEAILEYYAKDIVAEEKLGIDDHYEPVTDADREASRIVVNGIASVFPDDAVLSEEETDETTARLKKSRCWMIDPIDGTAGFVAKDGDFAVQIGLAIGGEPVLGVVAIPFYNEVQWAVKGSGAFRSVKGSSPAVMMTSPEAERSRMAMVASRHHYGKRLDRIVDHFGIATIVRRGSVGLKTGLIASAKCDIYINPGRRTKFWDTCAPQIILTEAGGRLTDLFGERIRYDRKDVQNHNGILATNGRSHELIVRELQPLLREFGRERVE